MLNKYVEKKLKVCDTQGNLELGQNPSYFRFAYVGIDVSPYQ